ncbi:MAG: hypothetical protein RL637_849 [Pseudomonadota bacterium]|jgi:dethiobiotin synthetase
MAKGFLITGTDTHIGKTWVTLALMRYFQAQQYRVVGMKPIASGCEYRNTQWYNEDALQLQCQASVALPYQLINPYAYSLPISPHLASDTNPVQFKTIESAYQQLASQAEIIFVEGIGGWLVPLNLQGQNIGDLAHQLNLTVILVVGIKLGCINHARLTDLAIQQSGCKTIGWIANIVDPDLLRLSETINDLKQRLSIPLLSTIHYQQNTIEVDSSLGLLLSIR